MELPWGSALTLMSDEDYGVKLQLDTEKGVLRFDRSQTQIRQGDVIRELPLDTDKAVHLQILADNSSLEVFINHGEHVMTGRVFTPESATLISLEGASVSAEFAPLKSVVESTFAPAV